MTQNSQNWIKYKDKIIDLSEVKKISLDWEEFQIDFYWKDGGYTAINFMPEEIEKAKNIFKSISAYLGATDLEENHEVQPE